MQCERCAQGAKGISGHWHLDEIATNPQGETGFACCVCGTRWLRTVSPDNDDYVWRDVART